MFPKRIVNLLVKDLEVSEFAQLAFDGDRFVSISMAASTAASYVAEAQRQHARMQRGHRAIIDEFRRMREWAGNPSKVGDPPRRSPAFPFAATHFYANCWTIVGRHLGAIRDISAFPEVGRALRPHRRTFDLYTALRDHYEHLDERLPGQKNQHRVGGNFYGLMTGNTLTFGNRSLDVGPASLTALRKAVWDVEESFKRAAIDLLERHHPERAEMLARRATGDRFFRSIQRRFARAQKPSG
jgi:hypothetical protein